VSVHYETLNTTEIYNCSGFVESGELYEFKVNAQNDIGVSDYSLQTPCIVPSNAIEYYMCQPANPPSQISTIDYSIGSYNVDIAWNEPSSSTTIVSYQLQRDDWWNGTSLFDVPLPNNGLLREALITNLLPGVPYHFRIRAQNKYGYSQWSNLLTLTTVDAGACGNLNDLTQQKEYYDTMQATITKIFAQCLTASDRDSCAQTKIESELGFSPACAECWVDDGNCSMQKCAVQCIDLSSESCYECSEENCFPSVVICTGLPEWTFPK